jgi:hypothetical protein
MKAYSRNINKILFFINKKVILVAFILSFFAISCVLMISGCKEELPIISDRIVSNETVDTALNQEPITLDLRPLSSIQLTTKEPDPDGSELLGVRFAAEGVYVMVEYKSPRELAENWREGSIYFIDEKTGTAYWDIPEVPVLGLLLGKPQEDGQKGYAMFKNISAGIKLDSIVTVVLGNYKREHIIVK